MANNQSRPPRRGPMGPGMGPGVGEKAKDFKSAVKRLVKELGKSKILIIIALILLQEQFYQFLHQIDYQN